MWLHLKQSQEIFPAGKSELIELTINLKVATIHHQISFAFLKANLTANDISR